jgi:hypothetical protein
VLLGTHWELEGNMLRTKEKWKKSAFSHHPPKNLMSKKFSQKKEFFY